MNHASNPSKAQSSNAPQPDPRHSSTPNPMTPDPMAPPPSNPAPNDPDRRSADPPRRPEEVPSRPPMQEIPAKPRRDLPQPDPERAMQGAPPLPSQR